MGKKNASILPLVFYCQWHLPLKSPTIAFFQGACKNATAFFQARSLLLPINQPYHSKRKQGHNHACTQRNKEFKNKKINSKNSKKKKKGEFSLKLRTLFPKAQLLHYFQMRQRTSYGASFPIGKSILDINQPVNLDEDIIIGNKKFFLIKWKYVEKRMSDLIHSQNKISTYVKGKSREIHISPILLEPNHDSSFYWLRLASQNQHQIWFSEGKKKKIPATNKCLRLSIFLVPLYTIPSKYHWTIGCLTLLTWEKNLILPTEGSS